MKTNRLYARKVAKIRFEWIEKTLSHLCSFSYKNIQWNDDIGTASAEREIRLGNQILAEKYISDFSSKSPARARELFIENCLIRELEDYYNDITKDEYFLAENINILDELIQIENKLRVRYRLLDLNSCRDFYKKNLSDDIIRRSDFVSSRNLNFSIENISYSYNKKDLPEYYEINGLSLPIYYQHCEGAWDDGACVEILLEKLFCVPNHISDLPPYLGEKLEHGMARYNVAKRGKNTTEIADDFRGKYVSNLSFMENFRNYFNTRLDKEILFEPEHKLKFWVCDADGNELAFGDNLQKIKDDLRDQYYDFLCEKFGFSKDIREIDFYYKFFVFEKKIFFYSEMAQKAKIDKDIDKFFNENSDYYALFANRYFDKLEFLKYKDLIEESVAIELLSKYSAKKLIKNGEDYLRAHLIDEFQKSQRDFYAMLIAIKKWNFENDIEKDLRKKIVNNQIDFRYAEHFYKYVKNGHVKLDFFEGYRDKFPFNEIYDLEFSNYILAIAKHFEPSLDLSRSAISINKLSKKINKLVIKINNFI